MKTPAFSIYNASAGSGKTYTLVKEYLKIILKAKHNDAYKNILAITFTNKAVFEMKTRIIDSLFDFSKDNPTEKSIQLMNDLGKEINLNQSQIKTKAQSIIKNIIHNYAAFDISTIDKFTHKVIRAFAFDLGLPITFDVSLDTENLLQEAVDAIVAQAGEDQVLTKLLVDFTMEKTDDDKSWDISSEIMNTGRLVLNENYREEILSLKDKTIPEFIALKAKLEETCKSLENQNINLANEAVLLIDSQGIDTKSFSRETFPNHLGFIQRSELKPTHKKFRTVDDIAVNKNAKDRDVIEGIANELIFILYKVYKNYEKKDFYQAFLKNITPLSLLNTVSNELAKIQEDQNILSISEFNKLIFEHIQNQPAPFIYERLGEKYKHFFIDEFQDTSEMQWQNLIPLIDNALSSEDLQGIQGSLMIVGDPKQSIYRWRGGKAEQFIDLAKTKNPFSNKDKEVFNLETNYRSFEAVIDFNNDFFKFLSQKFSNEDYKDLYENYSFQKSNAKKGGYVNISFIPEIDTDFVSEEDEENIDKNDIYLTTTLQTIIKVAAEGFLYNEIVLLTRNNKHGILLANYLTENDIPVISSESLLINASSEVKFILNMLRYLNDKNDIESLANGLYYLDQNLENNIETHDFIYQGIQYKDEIELEKWLANFGIQLSFQNSRRKSLYEIAELIAAKCINSENNNAYVQYFLDIVLERDVKYQMGISDFLEYWDKNGHKLSIPSAEGSNAIRIMTIHKSKGLEFPVVIFPFVEENYSAPKREKMWIDSQSDDLDFDKFLIDKSSKVKEYGENAASVYNQKSQEDLLDNINVLYVALTRAEEQLFIISNSKKRNSKGELPNNSASFFIEFLEDYKKFDSNILNYEFGNCKRISKQKPLEAKRKNIEAINSVINPNAIKIAQRESLMWGTHQQEAIEFGNVLHEILSFVQTKKDIPLALKKALETGLISENQQEEVAKTVIEIVFHPELNDFFHENSKVYNEQSIIKKGLQTIKPDRVTISGQNAYLLDYKTGKHQSKYENQLKEYELALIEMGFNVQKKSLIYIGENLEIVHL
ncbi:UvrD-helicase domain-containing protein [Flavobacterium psychrophilum]|uniref:DNA 3'-5' helicase n=1 Tax=Flavobacterium psychrophilum TaxID=96345 RepID=A0A7U2NG62_FLAPS|nr:UvrD-helicase domain-containing protein [Flavobacterium psychrophilum]QRE04408.1 UvrD-helicase domain-containing protein [Flavobacterium psychrophilum]